MAVLAITVNRIATGKDPQWLSAFMTATTAFAFVSPSSYVVPGAWSIGNEMVFYALTPFIVYVYQRHVALGNLITAATVLSSLSYARWGLSLANDLEAQITAYANPTSNLFMYCAGIALYYNLKGVQLSRTALHILLLASSVAFVLTPAEGDLIQIIAGPSRLALSAASVGFVLYFYKFPFRQQPTWWSVALRRLGTVTYGVYLLHPIAYRMARPFGQVDHPLLAAGVDGRAHGGV